MRTLADDVHEAIRDALSMVTRALRPLSWGDPMTPRGDGFVLPVGTVTLLLGDVEGSTQAWEAGDVGAALQRLSTDVDEAVGQHGGVRPVEQGEGDSFVAAFARPSDAVACALDIQRRLMPSSLRLRIGIHTGEVQLRGEGNYVGSTVNRAARLRDVGHGGQILISQATRDLVVDRLPPGSQLEDVGEHRLRDLRRPERIWQLAHPGLRRKFPPLRSLDRVPHNLPVQLTTFVGRQREVPEVVRLVRAHHLVTLTGIGGCGKTRLALEVAARIVDDRPGGTWFVDLSAVERADAVLGTVAARVGVEDAKGADLWAGLTATFGAGPTLLVLDNCEHLVRACAELVERLLIAVDSLTVVATSREILGVPGEVALRIPSLSVPAEDEPPRIAAVAACEAVELFAQRARRAEATFALSEANAATVGAICRRLDGIPLAIELAAARVRVLTPEQILQGLDECFSLLTGGARTVTPRQQTLEASVEWSHDLLSDPERVVLRRLSVFRGGFTLQAAKAVVTAPPVEPHHVLDLLSLLVDKSLVQHHDGRFSMLETIRQYAALRLAAAGEAEAVARRHRDQFLAVAEGDGPLLVGPDQAAALQRLEAGIDNLRAALQWCRDRNDNDEYLRLLVGLKHLWRVSGRLSEGHRWTVDVERRTSPPAASRGLHRRLYARWDRCIAGTSRRGGSGVLRGRR